MEANLKYIRGEVRKINEDERSVEFVISDETRDRHKTVLKADRWDFKNYKSNPIVGYMHEVWGGGFLTGPDPDMIIGRAEVWQEEKKTIGKVFFEPEDVNPMAEKIYKKVKFGSLSATSVGFIETKEGEYGTGKEAKGAENETYYYGGQELAEFSIVNIPSNPKALKRSIGDVYKSQVEKIRELIGDDLTEEDIKKLTLSGLISILTGEKRTVEVIEDQKEIETKEIETIQADIQLKRMRLELNKRK